MTLSAKTILRSAERALSAGDFDVVARTVSGPTKASYRGIPAGLHPDARSFLARRFPNGLYRHQALALEALLDGKDVCQATRTASGKTVAFVGHGLNVLRAEPGAKILAFYPTKALLQDQLDKWRSATAELGFCAARIDGSIPVAKRLEALERADVALMTPDVLHAWAMRRLGEARLRAVLERVRLVVLDEAHVYEGAFGANLAYLLRRFEQVAPRFQLLSATATLGNASEFLRKLTGRDTVVLGDDVDGAPTSERHVWVAQSDERDSLQAVARVVAALCTPDAGRFLVFADSRKMVERICQLVQRQLAAEASAEPDGADEGEVLAGHPRPNVGARVLPYRAGYEDRDREAIQRALAAGTISGVVSTCALELGLDIGDISTVLCVGMPSSLKSFRQRIGRAGRRSDACCIVLDTGRVHRGGDEGVERLLNAPVEPNRLYLDNRFLQYAHALCAAQELRDLGRRKGTRVRQSFASLPTGFRKLLSNELRPTQQVPQELFDLKQRCAQACPHHEFPLRGDVDVSLSVVLRGQPLGKLTYAQALREAYPGAVYLHLAASYRVVGFSKARREIRVKRIRGGSTRPTQRATVFPDLAHGVHRRFGSPAGFIAEAELQVSEQVLGFSELRGAKRKAHTYAVGSPYSERPINRFFTTTGICWRFDGLSPEHADALGALLARATATRFDLRPQDLGTGRFFARGGPNGGQELRGVCVYDSTFGSLRLSGHLLDDLPGVLDVARALCAREELAQLVGDVEELARQWSRCTEDAVLGNAAEQTSAGTSEADGRILVVAPGSKAMHHTSDEDREVIVTDLRYTPHGVLYVLEHEEVRHMVALRTVRAIHGVSELGWFDPCTYEVVPVADGEAGVAAESSCSLLRLHAAC